MKIKHLLEYTFPTIQNVNVGARKHPGRAASRDSDTKHMGRGSFADVWHNPQKTPHDVRKVSKGSKRYRIDGFYYYMLALEKHPDNTNPYFPRFRKIKIYTDRYTDSAGGQSAGNSGDDHITYSTQIEKLIPLQELTKTEEQAILFRLFGDRQHRGHIASEFIENILTMNRTWGILIGIIKISLSTNLGLIKLIVDEDFKNAIKFLKKVQKYENIQYDIHASNIMIRRTAYGPQLVFSDPFSYQM